MTATRAAVIAAVALTLVVALTVVLFPAWSGGCQMDDSLGSTETCP